LSALAAFALDHRSYGILGLREARHLPPEVQATVGTRIDRVRDGLALVFHPDGLDGRPEADIAASAALAVLLSPSFHQHELPRPDYDAVLADLANRVLTSRLPSAPKPARKGPGLRRGSIRAQLLSKAIGLFAERTYASVSMEDIAASMGMAASSVYNYFPSKLDMLLTAFNNGNGYLQLTLDETLATADQPAGALRSLVVSYSRFALGHPHLVNMLITEVRNLPPVESEAMLRVQRDYVDEWVQLLRQVHGGLDAISARITVQATLMMINDLARIDEVRSRSDAEAMVVALGHRVLSL
jgi:AcrR family transcriptional regulator